VSSVSPQAEVEVDGESAVGRPTWELVATAIVLIYFAARLAYLALRVVPSIPPDEISHVGRILAYAQTWWIPPESPDSFAFGLLGERPWLYYWLMARLTRLSSDLVFLRLANAALALATAWIAVLWAREWSAQPLERLLVLVLLTNTLMFTGIGATVSYDNATNFLAAAALLTFTRLGRSARTLPLLGFSATVLAGCLVKRSFLPLAALFAGLFLWRYGRELPQRLRRLRLELRQPLPLAMTLGVLVLAGLNLQLYAGNLAHYGRLVPHFDQVVGLENALDNRIFARNQIVELYRQGRVDLEQAQRMARDIPLPGDRVATLQLLDAARQPASSRAGPFQYAFEWSRSMLANTIGYLGHEQAERRPSSLLPYATLVGLAVFLFLYSLLRGRASRTLIDASLLSLGYALILLWLVHYPSYLRSGHFGLALQGRYLFPVLLPIYALIVHPLFAACPAPARPWLTLGVGGLFVAGDLPWLLANVGPQWFVVR
jgi:hypothetical protein